MIATTAAAMAGAIETPVRLGFFLGVLLLGIMPITSGDKSGRLDSNQRSRASEARDHSGLVHVPSQVAELSKSAFIQWDQRDLNPHAAG